MQPKNGMHWPLDLARKGGLKTAGNQLSSDEERKDAKNMAPNQGISRGRQNYGSNNTGKSGKDAKNMAPRVQQRVQGGKKFSLL
jgi:hypothetical protein